MSSVVLLRQNSFTLHTENMNTSIPSLCLSKMLLESMQDQQGELGGPGVSAGIDVSGVPAVSGVPGVLGVLGRTGEGGEFGALDEDSVKTKTNNLFCESNEDPVWV